MTHHQSIELQSKGMGRAFVPVAKASTPPGPGEVAVTVAYSGVNFADILMRLALYRDAPPLPFVPGYEISGVVEAIGDGVTTLAVGDRVIAGTFFGGYTARAVLPETNVFRLPDDMTMQEGAALPVSFFTAQMVLGEMARVRAGDRVLIDAATGGVGVIATKMAVALGAKVVGLTTTPKKKSFIAEMGAEAYTHDEFAANAEIDKFDLIVNSAGGASVGQQSARLAIGGRIVCMGVSSAIVNGKRSLPRAIWTILKMPRISVLRLFKSSTGIFGINVLTVMKDPAWVARLSKSFSKFATQGIRPHIGAVVPWREVDRALALLEQKQVTGKVLLAWDAAATIPAKAS